MLSSGGDVQQDGSGLSEPSVLSLFLSVLSVERKHAELSGVLPVLLLVFFCFFFYWIK